MTLSNALARLFSPREAAVSVPQPLVVQVEQPEHSEPHVNLAPEIPAGLTIAAGYTWRLLLLGVGMVGLFMALGYFSQLTVPLAIAILLAAMLYPIADRLKRWGWPPPWRLWRRCSSWS